jgi:hypothetical protein
VNQDLVAIRNEMLGAVHEQQASEVFWSVLSALIEHGAVSIEPGPREAGGKPVIGKPLPPPYRQDLHYLSTDLALAEVNKCLRAQSRPELRVTASTLLGQLRREGRLLDMRGQALGPVGDAPPTRQPRIGGEPRRAFITSRALLNGALERYTDLWPAEPPGAAQGA